MCNTLFPKQQGATGQTSGGSVVFAAQRGTWGRAERTSLPSPFRRSSQLMKELYWERVRSLTMNASQVSQNYIHNSLTCVFSSRLSPSHWGCMEIHKPPLLISQFVHPQLFYLLSSCLRPSHMKCKQRAIRREQSRKQAINKMRHPCFITVFESEVN